MKTLLRHYLITMLFCLITQAGVAQSLNQIQPVSFSQVTVTDEFWKPRLAKVAAVTIPVCIEQTEVKTPRIENFEKVARRKGEKHEGIYYDDSDVYKALEAMAYSLRTTPSAEMEAKADEWIDKIAAAQEPDGYLNTYYSLSGLDRRWTDMEKHEDYCAGHLIEAAVAYAQTTGKRKLLNVAIRLADHIDSMFRQSNRPWVSGHQEIELALVKLAAMTEEKRYLALADWFLQQRGRGHGKGAIWDQWKAPEYCQDAVPVKEQREITGHAVRAMYMYSGAADVAAALNDSAYMRSMKTVWEDVVYRNMYLTGGIGSSGRNEGFTRDYDLPNETAYCETCASVGMVFWNQRMNRLTGDSKYADVLERSLYNGALDGLSFSGDRFFYGNPLASTGNHQRSEWFGTACCPANISRLIASVGDYIYSVSDDAVWINLFVGSSTSLKLQRGEMSIRQTTRYPWEGKVAVEVTPSRKMKARLMIRIPGWAKGTPVPGETYRLLGEKPKDIVLLVNGKEFKYRDFNGYAMIDREWKKGDVVTFELPMNVRRVVSSDLVTANAGLVALERGPLVYCIEHADNNGKVTNVVLPDDAAVVPDFRPDLLGGLTTLRCSARAAVPAPDGQSIQTITREIIAIPYFAWANRGAGEMQVWIPRKVQQVIVR